MSFFLDYNKDENHFLPPQQPPDFPLSSLAAFAFFSLCRDSVTVWLPAGLNSYTPSTRSCPRLVALPTPAAPGCLCYESLVAFCASISIEREEKRLASKFWLIDLQIACLLIDRSTDGILTFCKCREYVLNIISILCWSLHVLNTLGSCELICVIFLNCMIHDVALIASENDRCFAPDFTH